ncbi:hypothetical protein N8I77_012230 [Diaporthe amygdali]|uniref:ASST-domain-containing protein n=1 Tax=Phomopsis amygdali TaxID=1214568 RepID=A0AAD9W0I5_PHOAM|nr:hypothetical protein N8I77_012230 [Diaporthe amygdali]KAK2598846.1 hypothetical protein N8I77_012230 [Diaporthe amygdali]
MDSRLAAATRMARPQTSIAMLAEAWKPSPRVRSVLRDKLRQLYTSTAARAIFILASVVVLGIGLSSLWSNVLDRIHIHHDMSWYGLGLYGLAPSTQYESFAALTPSLEYPRWDARCSQDYVFLGWRGHEVDEPGAVILDNKGELVWRQTGSDEDQNDVRPQMYRGERFLTFQMDGPNGNRSQGYWYMMDQSYTIRYRIRPKGFPHADMHEFQITNDNTAVIVTTIPIPYDLRSVGGPEHGWLENGYFQELDIETGELLFEWSSIDHFLPNTTMEPQDNCLIDPKARFAGCGDKEDSAFDYYHLNSVEKDSKGNYLISGRNMWGISYIDGRNGDVLWTLGAGEVNDFKDLSDGAALEFSWQHFARWVEEGKSLSFFDNHYHRIGDPAGESGGRVVDIDVPNRTVQLRKAYNHPHHIRPESQGNIQHLDNGNYMVGWGSSGAFTEFAGDGEVLCDARFGAEAFFEFSPVSSYRVFRGEWTGRPLYPPSVALNSGQAYVSWNGATEVVKWQVEMKNENSQTVHVIAQAFKDGFETTIDLPTNAADSLVRVVALGVDGEVLDASAFKRVPKWDSFRTTLNNLIVFSILAVFIASLCGMMIWWTYVREDHEFTRGYKELGKQIDNVHLMRQTFWKMCSELSLYNTVDKVVSKGGRFSYSNRSSTYFGFPLSSLPESLLVLSQTARLNHLVLIMKTNGVATWWLISSSLYASHAAGAADTIFYDETWAGPVRLAVGGTTPSSTNTSSSNSTWAGFNRVEATLVMPQLAIPSHPSERVDQYTAAFWIGLDGFVLSGDEAQGTGTGTVRGLWQAGVFMSIWENGTSAYTGFYEWVPNDPISLTSSQLAISEGDHVHVVVETSDGGYYGNTSLTNLNTSQTYSFGQEAPTTWRGPTWPSPGTSAEWIIEAGTYLNSTRHIFPDWGNATMLNAKACYGDNDSACIMAGAADENDLRMTAMRLNETGMLYTRSYVESDRVWVAYVEEPFVE